MVLLLNRDEVARVVQMPDCLEVVEQAFTELSNGSAALPLRTPVRSPDGLSLYMPAYLQELGAMAVKVVSVYKDNPARHDLPVILAKVLVQDPATGDVVCMARSTTRLAVSRLMSVVLSSRGAREAWQ